MTDIHLNTRLLEIPVSNSCLTMSSREIAELTGSTHDNVLKTIRNLIKKGVVFGNETPYVHEQNGQTYYEFRLDYRNTMIVVSGYSPELRAKVIDRWMELEQGFKNPQPAFDPSDPKVLLTVFQHLQAQVAEKDKIIEIQSEKVKQLDRIEAAEGSMCISDAAKTLKVHPLKQLFSLMSAWRWIYKRTGNKNWLAYQDKIQSGYMEHKDHLYIDNMGVERVSTHAYVTAKGLVKLADLLENHKIH